MWLAVIIVDWILQPAYYLISLQSLFGFLSFPPPDDPIASPFHLCKTIASNINLIWHKVTVKWTGVQIDDFKIKIFHCLSYYYYISVFVSSTFLGFEGFFCLFFPGPRVGTAPRKRLGVAPTVSCVLCNYGQAARLDIACAITQPRPTFLRLRV